MERAEQLERELMRQIQANLRTMTLKYHFDFRHGLPLSSDRFVYSPLTAGGTPQTVTQKTPLTERPKTG